MTTGSARAGIYTALGFAVATPILVADGGARRELKLVMTSDFDHRFDYLFAVRVSSQGAGRPRLEDQRSEETHKAGASLGRGAHSN
jgi:hypothetical protein